MPGRTLFLGVKTRNEFSAKHEPTSAKNEETNHHQIDNGVLGCTGTRKGQRKQQRAEDRNDEGSSRAGHKSDHKRTEKSHRV